MTIIKEIRENVDNKTSVCVASWHKLLEHTERLESAALSTASPAAQGVPDGYAQGVEAVALMIEKKRDDYHFENGSQESDTGAWNYPGDGQDWMNTMDELAEEIRAMLAAAPAQPTEQTAKHRDDIAVDSTATAVKAKLAKKRDEGRGGWNKEDECTMKLLAELLVEHVAKGDPIDIVAFATFLHQRELMAIEHHPCNGGEAKRVITAAFAKAMQTAARPDIRQQEREECAKLAVQWGNARKDEGGGNALRNYAQALREGVQPCAKAAIEQEAELRREARDVARLNLLETMVENGCVTMCFEMDGGVHLTLEGVGEEPEAYRNQNTIRDALDAAIAKGVKGGV